MRRHAAWIASLAIPLALATRAEAAPTEDQRSYDTPYEAGFRRDENGELVYRDREARWTATLLPDGRVRFEDDLGPHFDKRRGGIAIPGLAELVPAARGYEFSQARKRRLLRETEQMRLRMAADYAASNMEDELELVSADMMAIWRDWSKGASQRRELIFLRWDECEESPPGDPLDVADERTSQVDAMRQLAGERAREKIVAFVRLHLPEDSPSAYSDEELRRLNARRESRERFDPYVAASP
jgi:hypothetical protein